MINLGILAHVDAGKTTLTENLLFTSGSIRKIGRVDHGTAVTDNLAVERSRGITVKTTTVSFCWNSKKINLLDTPGHMDFVGEVERSLRVLDGAVLVISAKEGVQLQTRFIFNALKRLRIPTLFFVNKIDRVGVDLDSLYKDIQHHLCPDTVCMQSVLLQQEAQTLLPISTRTLWETLALYDDDLFTLFANNSEPPAALLRDSLAALTKQCAVVPVYHGSALKGFGIEPLLDAIACLLPEYQCPSGLSEETVSAVVYKIDRSEQGWKRNYMKVLSGVLSCRQTISIAQRDEVIKLKSLKSFHGAVLEDAESIPAGDVCVLVGASPLQIGDMLGDALSIAAMPLVKISEPTLVISLYPANPANRLDFIAAALLLGEEDPALDMAMNSETGEITAKLYGVVQQEILKTMIRDRFGLEALLSEPKTILKETPTDKAYAEIRLGQSHCRAGIGLTIEKGEPGSGFVYRNRVSYGSLSKSFQTAVYEGLLKALANGLSGFTVIDLICTFELADYDSVTSTPRDFRDLVATVFHQALRQSKTELLEPILSFEAIVPSFSAGKVIADIQKLRGTISESQRLYDEIRITGTIPVETSKDYPIRFAGETAGRGIWMTEFFCYRPLA